MVTRENRNKKRGKIANMVYSKYVKYLAVTDEEHGLYHGHIYKVVDQDVNYFCIQVIDYYGYWYPREWFEHSDETKETNPVKYDYSITEIKRL